MSHWTPDPKGKWGKDRKNAENAYFISAFWISNWTIADKPGNVPPWISFIWFKLFLVHGYLVSFDPHDPTEKTYKGHEYKIK